MRRSTPFFLLLFFVTLGLFGTDLQNLFPDGTQVRNDEMPGSWHRTPYNGNTTKVGYYNDPATRLLEVERSGEKGYSAWRVILQLEPGQYTLDTRLNGQGHLGIDAYGFTADGKPEPVILIDSPSCDKRPFDLVHHFTLKPGLVKVRFGFTVYDNGSASFVFPRLFKGHLTKEQLPPQPPTAAQKLPPVIDLMSGIKAFQLDEEAAKNEKYVDPTTGIVMALDAGKTSRNGRVNHTNTGWHFQLKNRPTDIASVTWTANFSPLEIKENSWIELKFSILGHHYEKRAYPVIILNQLPLLTSSEIYNDGRMHRVLIRMTKKMTASQLKLAFRTDAEQLDVHLAGIRILHHYSQLDSVTASDAAGSEAIDLTACFRSSYPEAISEFLAQRHKIYDAMQLPEAGGIQLDGASFTLGGKRTLVWGTRHISSKPEDRQNAADGYPNKMWADTLDDLITIPVTGKARELWVLLAAKMVEFPQIGAAPAQPPQFATHEVLEVEVNYADGTTDKTYPYSLADKGFVIQRTLGAYAIPLNPQKELSRVLIHNYFRNAFGATGLLAATVNRTGRCLIPDEALNPEPYEVKQLAMPDASPLKVTADNGSFTMENGFYKLTATAGNSFDITAFEQKLNPNAPMTLGTGGFEVDVNGQQLTGKDFKVTSLTPRNTGVELVLVSNRTDIPLEMTYAITGNDSTELRFNASITNKGEKPLEPRLRFPVLNQVKLGNLKDNWIYFPKYTTLQTNQVTYGLCPSNERAYFVQFYDGFNPRAGYGLALITHNFQKDVIDYGLFKTLDGLKYFIQYPAPWHALAPSQTRQLVETSLILHTNDWHGALESYKAWVKSWYKPLKKQKLEWWENTWVHYGQLLTKPYGWVIPTYDETTGQFIMMDQLKAATRRWNGLIPLTHVWGWNMPANLYPGEKPRTGTPNSNYADGENNPANYRGSADKLCKAFAELQAAGSPVSIYNIPAYLPKASPIGRAKGKALTQVTEDGGLIEDDQCWFPCSWAWCDTFVSAIVRAQKITKCNAVYIDISPFPRGYTCYSPNHGHPVPLNTNLSSHRILKSLREQLPEGVALWHEDPAGDIDTQYSNGSITYYSIPTSEHRAPNYGNTTLANATSPARQSILRFVFPKYKTFVNLVGLDSGEIPMAQYSVHFFNGEGLTDSTFGYFTDRNMPVVQKIARLEQTYHDCFLGSNPQPQVPTLAGGIQANCFPNDNGRQTLWTFWNGRFSTFRGPVLEVDTLPGETWSNPWNDKPIGIEHRHGKSIISLELDPHLPACILRTIQSN